MNKKTIIQVIIIIIAFGGSGFVLYNGLFKKTPTVDMTGTIARTPAVKPEEILPYGDTLDFKKVLDRQRFEFGVLVPPKLMPGTEVGITENNLIPPAVKKSQ